MPAWRRLLLFARLSRPLFLIGGALLYGLGAAIARYNGHTVQLQLLLLGQGVVTALQLMTHYLNEYEDAETDADNPNRTWLTGGSGVLGANGLPRRTALNAGLVSLAVAAVLASLLALEGVRGAGSWLTLVLIFLGAYFYSAPPLRLARSGYGEVTTSLVVAGLVPAFAESLQSGSVSWLLVLSTAPLAALHFAMVLAFETPDYATDARLGKRTLMVRLGWRTAMRLHDAAIGFAVAAVLFAGLNGLPQSVMAGSIIAFPLAAAQVWQMHRLRQGFRPQWRSLTFGGMALFALAAYLELAGYLLAG